MGLAAILAYPLGFLIVILGRAQLFTENTVTPVTVALTDPRSVPNMLRLWVVVFVANVLGAIVFSAVIVYGHILEPGALKILFEEVSHKAEYGFGGVFLKAKRPASRAKSKTARPRAARSPISRPHCRCTPRTSTPKTSRRSPNGCRLRRLFEEGRHAAACGPSCCTYTTILCPPPRVGRLF